MSIVWNHSPQGSEGWHAARRGALTASMFKVCRDRKQDGVFTEKALNYARDTARMRFGGNAPDVYVNSAMRFGTEQEPLCRQAYELQTGLMVTEVGFAHTFDRKFGCSVDGLVHPDGMVEIKTLVSSATLFDVLVDGDISEYIDQINGCMWLLGLKWCDLCLWAPDLPTGQLTIVRIERNEDEIEALEADLWAFDQLVCTYEAALRNRIGGSFAPAESASEAPQMTLIDDIFK